MSGAVLVGVYFLVTVLPLLFILVLTAPAEHGLAFDIGRSFALVGCVVIFLQPLLASRLSWTERPFGFDIVIRFHKAMGLFAALLLLSHPVLLAAGGAGWGLLISLDLPWYIWVGKATLLVLLIHTVLALGWERMGLKFERWRSSHVVLAPAVIAGAFVHSWVVGDDLELLPFQVLWIVLLLTAGFAFLYRGALKPLWLGRSPYEVVDVVQETPNVWTVRLAPQGGGQPYAHLPGQFHFLTFERGRGLPHEEHHWTISSSPTDPTTISSTIKESGDFTATIGQTRAGDSVLVEGPFGRFSYMLHPDDRNVVFIAGGIGITPIMAMLRHMRDTGSELPVLLIYANHSEQDIVFRDELDAIMTAGTPRLQVIHILSNPSDSWSGEHGYVDAEKLGRFLNHQFANRSYYICCPPAMADKVIEALHNAGVAYGHMRTERFSL